MTVTDAVSTGVVGAAGRRVRLAVAGGMAAATGVVALADPASQAGYPLCPSRSLLGLDCPACGGLRGTHALLHGRVGEALDHNLLLPLILAGMAVTLGLWLLPLVGRATPQVRLPRWSVAAVVLVLTAFTVARNLPVDGLAFLASDAS